MNYEFKTRVILLVGFCVMVLMPFVASEKIQFLLILFVAIPVLLTHAFIIINNCSEKN